MKKRFNINIDFIFFILFVFGIVYTFIYIFHTSTALLTSDSVITDVIAHQQILNKEIFLTHWYYGNEFWLFSLSIPTVLLSFTIKNNLLLRQVSILLTAIIFFFLLYQYGKKFIGKKEGMILVIIFLTGISYSVLDYFYSYDSCVIIIIHSMLLLFLYYKGINEKDSKKIYYILSLILTFILGIDNLQYFPLVILPFLLVEFVLFHKKISWKKIGVIFLISVVAFLSFNVLASTFKTDYSKRLKIVNNFTKKDIEKRVKAMIDIHLSFFGYDNRNHPLSSLAGQQYFLKQNKTYSIMSIYGVSNFIKFMAHIIFMIVVPIMLFKNYKKNSKEINFLLVFNTISWILMILYYFLFNRFTYFAGDLKYFLFNFVINILLGIYFLSVYFSKFKLYSFLYQTFLMSYLLSNLYTTHLIITEHNKKVIKQKFELVELLKKNNLTFGYGGYYNSLLTSYLSNYEITVANILYKSDLVPYYLNSDERWYQQHDQVFILFDKKKMEKYQQYERKYGRADATLTCDSYVVLVYNKNPILK